MKRLKFYGAIIVLILILLKPETAVAAGQRAMRIWCSSVAPALFPFLALMPVLTSKEACEVYGVLFSRWMRPLFNLPGSAAPAVIIGMISGSPGGALALRRVASQTEMTEQEIKSIAFALGGVSPAYLILGVGQGLYDSAALGMQLAAVQAGIQFAMLIVIPRLLHSRTKTLAIRPMCEKKNPIMDAAESLLGICGYMMIFSVIAAILAGYLGKEIGTALLLILDLPSGLAELAAGKFRTWQVLQGAAIGFGGLCIISQNMDVLKTLGIRWGSYIKARMTISLLFACIYGGMRFTNKEIGSRTASSLKITYAGSLLIATIIMIPILFLLSKELFFNKRKNG